MIFGAWRSPVAHHNGVVGVAGSNPVAPTEKGSKESFLVYGQLDNFNNFKSSSWLI